MDYWSRHLSPLLPMSLGSRGSKSGPVRLEVVGQGQENSTYAAWRMPVATLWNHSSCLHWSWGDSGCFYLDEARILNIHKWGSARFETNRINRRFYRRWCPGILQDDSSEYTSEGRREKSNSFVATSSSPSIKWLHFQIAFYFMLK